MASYTLALQCFVISVALFSCLALEFSILRTPGNNYCARLECNNDAAPSDGSKYTNRRLTIFDITLISTKIKLAQLMLSGKELDIDPTKTLDINGTGSINQQHAGVRLDLLSPSDCFYGTFQCEVEFVNSEGKKQVVRKTIAPEKESIDDDCSCSSFRYRFSKLTNRADGTSRQIVGLGLSIENLQADVNGLATNSKTTSDEIARLQQGNQIKFGDINELKANNRRIDQEISDLQRNDSKANDEIEELKGNDQSLVEDLNAIRNTDQARTKELAELRSVNKAQEETINTLEYKVTVAREDVVQLQNKDDVLQGDINQLRTDNEVVSTNVNELRENDIADTQEVSDLKTNDNNRQETINVLKHNDSVRQQDVIDLRRADLILGEDIAQLQHKDTISEDELIDLRQRNNEQLEDIANLKNNDRSNEAELNTLAAGDVKSKDGLVILQQTDVDLQTQIDQLKDIYQGYGQNAAILASTDAASAIALSELRISDISIQDRIDGIASTSAAIATGVQELRDYRRSIDAEIDSVSELLAVIEAFLNASQVTTVTKTISSLTQVTCLRGQASTSSRASFLLFGTIPALCDTTTDGGGWVIIQRRTNGFVNFYRGWNDYKIGFGNPESSDYWIGNDVIHNLTSQGFNEIIFSLELDGQRSYAQYSKFSVGSESSKYKLSVSGYRGTAGDSFTYHDGSAFTTYDQDNDNSPYSNCAEVKGGAWWYNSCYRSNLNGKWGKDAEDGVIWKSLSELKSLSFVEIMVRYVGY